VQKLRNSTSELHQLKTLLLSDELEQLKQLEAKLKTLDFTSNDEESIIAKVMPLLDKMLLQRFENKEDEVLSLLSEHLAQMIAQASQKDQAKLSRALQATLAPAISKEIAANKDTMIDALYPIMGGMISKYVTQAIKKIMESINTKIEDGLSYNRYKRKIKSKVTGVSETELLLEESNDTLISSLFVIEKESGILIAEAHLEDKEIDDPHMVASMASAIKDFINDWIQNDKKQSEIQILSYGNATLYIESAGSVYIIAFLDAEPNYELRTNINTFFASIVKEYATFFQSFDGDDSAEEIVILSQKLKAYLVVQKTLKKSSSNTSSRNPVKYLLMVFSTVLLIGLGYYAKEQYFEYQLEKKIKNSTGYSVKIESENDKLILAGKIESFSDAQKIVKLIEKMSLLPITNNLQMSILNVQKEIVENQKRTTYTIEKKLERLVSKNQNDSIEIEEKVDKKLEEYDKNLKELKAYLMLKLNEKTAKIDKLKQQELAIKNVAKLHEKIIVKLAKVFTSNIVFNVKEGSLDFSNSNMFKAGNTMLNRDIKITIKNNFETYTKQLMQDKEAKKYIKAIVIEGYSDSSGDPLVNQKLSQDRAELVKEYLLTLDIAQTFHLKSLLLSKGLASTQLIFKDGIEDKEASRRIKIKFILDKNKMIQEIGKIVI